MLYDTREKILATAEPDQELAELLSNNPLPPADWSNINAIISGSRSRRPDLLKALGEPPAGVKQNETTYETRDGAKLRVKVYQPASAAGREAALVLLFHGGGFCTGQPENEELTARNLVQELGAVCLSASYRLAPEHAFPQAAEDAWDALKWASSQFEALGASQKAGFIVGGSSAGANLSAVVVHRARDENLMPALTGQYLAIPTVCPKSVMSEKYRKSYYSWEQNRDGLVLPVAAVEAFFKAYGADYADTSRFAILNHPKGHSGLPPAVIVADGADPLRDEALIYEKVLREEAGIKTRLYVYPSMPHSHWSFFPTLKQSKQFRHDQVEAFRWLLASN